MRTVIAINTNSKGSFDKNRDAMDYGKELWEVIELTEKAKRRLAIRWQGIMMDGHVPGMIL